MKLEHKERKEKEPFQSENFMRRNVGVEENVVDPWHTISNC